LCTKTPYFVELMMDGVWSASSKLRQGPIALIDRTDPNGEPEVIATAGDGSGATDPTLTSYSRVRDVSRDIQVRCEPYSALVAHIVGFQIWYAIRRLLRVSAG
jgi:hypothetical protein